MTLDAEVLSAYAIVKLAIAVWLMSRALPRRAHFGIRAACVTTCVTALAVAMPTLGFSVYPSLTDDASFLVAVLSFVGTLAAATLAQRFLFAAPLWTSIFCCSTAYLVENLSSSVERAMTALIPRQSYPPELISGSVQHWVVTAVVYALIYLLFIRRLERRGLLAINDRVMVVSAVLVIAVNMTLDLIIKDVATFEAIPKRYELGLDVIHVLLCVYLLYSSFEVVYNRRLLVDVATVERLRVTEARQYQMSRENIEAINLKCHDIKHQIRTLRDGDAVVNAAVLDELSRKVDVYDSVVKSGNDALDTILTEKGLVCQQRGVTLSCIADGSAVDFMAAVDLYSLFGNALDNAIEAVSAIEDVERRSISLIVQRVGDMASVHVENLFDGVVQMGEDGLPVTSKGDTRNHGFGMRSMRRIVEDYGGTLVARTEGDAFMLDALIPLP